MAKQINTKKKGNYYCAKTKKYFEKLGWVVKKSEATKMAYFGGRLVPIRTDLFGSDLIAMNGIEIMFIQSKTNKRDMIKGDIEFRKYPFPPCVKRIVTRWEVRAREPIIIEIN